MARNWKMEEKQIVLIGFIAIVVLFFLFRKSGSSNVKSNPTEQDILDSIKSGKKVTAIKYYRQIHGVGLKEAKDAVDSIEASGSNS